MRAEHNGYSLPSRPDQFLTVNGVRLCYLDWGGTGDAVVLLHGSGDSPHVYDRLAPALAERFRVVALARRGHYLSDRRGPYDLGTRVEDLRQFLLALGLVPAALVGHSAASIELTGLTQQHPELVSKLVYLDPGGELWLGAAEEALKTYPLGHGAPQVFDSYDDIYRQLVDEFYAAGVPEGGENQLRGLVRQRGDGRWERHHSMEDALATIRDLGETLNFRPVQAPALVLCAEFPGARQGYPEALQVRLNAWQDAKMQPLFAAWRTLLWFRAPQAIMKTIPGTTHAGLVFQAHDLVCREVSAFLTAAVPPAA